MNKIIITSSSKYVHITNGNGYHTPCHGGAVTYDYSTGSMSVCNGQTVSQISPPELQISSPAVDSAVDWVMNKIQEERSIALLAEQHVGIKDLLDQKAKIDTMLTLMVNLVKDHSK